MFSVILYSLVLPPLHPAHTMFWFYSLCIFGFYVRFYSKKNSTAEKNGKTLGWLPPALANNLRGCKKFLSKASPCPYDWYKIALGWQAFYSFFFFFFKSLRFRISLTGELSEILFGATDKVTNATDICAALLAFTLVILFRAQLSPACRSLRGAQ